VQFCFVNKLFTILFCAGSLAFFGCATKPKVDKNRDWNAYVGQYSYQQALEELGKPYVVGEQSDGSRFAEWILRRSPQMSFGFGVGGGSYGRGGGVGVGAGTSISPRPRGEYLRLEFGTNQMLRAWSKIKT
jgi:hypothetical protein